MEQLLLRSKSAVAAVSTGYQRTLMQEVHWSDPLIFILGPRGVGKTTLLLQRLRALGLPPRQALYVDLGDMYFQAHHLIEVAEAFLDRGGEYLFIDEVHRYVNGNWAAELKQIYDLYRTRLQVVVTGSSVVRILTHQADLSRRVLSYRLSGLSFREYLRLQHGVKLPVHSLTDVLERHETIVDDLLPQLPDVLPELQRYWQIGYYPYYLQGTVGYTDRVVSSLQTVLEHDIPYATDAASVDARKLARLMYAIASSAPFLPDMVKLSQRTEISRSSLLRYFKLLEDANLIRSLRKESRGLAALGKPDKLYLDNPNLLHALAPQQVNLGTLRETFFMNQLAQLTYSKALVPPEIKLPGSGDFVFLTPDRRLLFEVGGRNKSFKQIGEAPGHYVVADTLRTGHSGRVPLWLFGFLY
ncbi:ATP-binding protein [Neolewinella sp.]|uniref:ATP-binding protein n=1 Tax=Neolewinella sp. TaxID=2993543 RepID=UPI003B51EB8C